MKTSPAGGLVEGGEILGVIEHTEQIVYLATVLLVVGREDCTAVQEAHFVIGQELLDEFLERSEKKNYFLIIKFLIDFV